MLIKEVEAGLWTNETIPKAGASVNSERVFFNGPLTRVFAGNDCLTKICVLLGVSSIDSEADEIAKVKALAGQHTKPDMIVDLSIVRSKESRLYNTVLEHVGCPAGTIPIYYLFNTKSGISPISLFNEYRQHVEDGCSIFTLHCTPTDGLLKQAIDRRSVPTTSRGGALVVRDLILNKRKENVFYLIKDELASLFRENDCVVSIASSFRASSILETLDEVQKSEIDLQNKWVQFFKENNVQVMIEGPGHCPISKMESYATLTKLQLNIPMMTLGPIPTDVAAGLDHISASIGLAAFSLYHGVDIINPITRHEHCGGVPSVNDVIEAFQAAQVVAHAIDISKLNYIEPDYLVYKERARGASCVIGQPIINGFKSISAKHAGCSRCRWACPLMIKDYLSQS